MTPKNRPGRGMRWAFRGAVAVAAVAAALLAYHGVATWQVGRVDAAVPRVDGGVMAGAEEARLGPDDAETAVLLVHGFVGATSNFGALPAALADAGFRVRALRLPGHGTSPRDLRDVSADELLADVRAELAALKDGHARVVVVGHSMGGTLATLAVAKDGADGLVLAAPYFGVAHRWWYGLRPATWTALASPLLRWVYKGDVFLQVNRAEAKPLIVSYDWVPSEGLVTLHALGAMARDPEVLAAVECPVLWLHGPGDVAASHEAAGEAVDGMAAERVKRVALERSNHHVFWDYDREEAIEAVVGFVEKVAE
jgi:carboxylesterase